MVDGKLSNYERSLLCQAHFKAKHSAQTIRSSLVIGLILIVIVGSLDTVQAAIARKQVGKQTGNHGINGNG